MDGLLQNQGSLKYYWFSTINKKFINQLKIGFSFKIKSLKLKFSSIFAQKLSIKFDINMKTVPLF